MKDKTMPLRQTHESEEETDTSALPTGRLFVTFIVADEVFAVDMAPVQEIIRVPQAARIPLAPSALNGLANLRGKVLPIVSLRRVFGFPDRELDDASRAVVIDHGQSIGFVVDRVSSVIEVDPQTVEEVGAVSNLVKSELLSGILKNVDGHSVIMVLDFKQLVDKEFGCSPPITTGFATGAIKHDSVEEEQTNELQLVSFEVAEQEYAIPIEKVQEIVQLPDNIVQVPKSATYVLGLITLRNRLLPLVALGDLFGLSGQVLNDRSRVVVINSGTMAVGLVMDSVNEVLRVPHTVVDAVPLLLTHANGLGEIESICRLDGGKRLVSVIDPGRLFEDYPLRDELEKIHTFQEQTLHAESDELEEEEENQFVVFGLGEEEFGVPIACVQEIVRVPQELTHVPRAPSFVQGVINLRGGVLPVIDQRLRLGLAELTRNDRQRIVVFLIGGVRTGFIVDTVKEVLRLPEDSIQPAPHLSAEQEKLITGVANLEQEHRLIMLMDPNQLLDERDLDVLGILEEC